MSSTSKIFKDRLINNYLSKFDKANIPCFDSKWNCILKWRKACIQSDLEHTKETQIQGAFMVQIFDEILGYNTVISKDEEKFYQKQEFKSVLDASEADGALGFFLTKPELNDVRAVIELKPASVDLDKKQNRSNHLTPIEQGFSYANKNGRKCGWVIVSNFVETRLYKSNSSLEYEVFDITQMDDEKEFLRFYFLLCRENLINEKEKSLIDRLYDENEKIGIDISNDFYKSYKNIRNDLFLSLKHTNPEKNEIELFTKAQKIMDRFIFICFCEDCGLLPPNIYEQLIEATRHSFSFSTNKIWSELKGLFKSIDKGNPSMKINKYNGGLFREDEELDSLVVSDDVLETFTILSKYDFSSDLNVNILGQIFEQSISDVEQIKNDISGINADKRGKQKDDGIFYTPYYVTRYIVEQTVGTYLKEKKEELKKSIFNFGSFKTEVLRESTHRKNTIELDSWVELPRETIEMTEDEKIYRNAVMQLHLKYWSEYENILKNIKICDPACGSGAFLNQCFDYLYAEMNFAIDMKSTMGGAQVSIDDINNEILQNNLFGVDINPESVEITKLSLWLKTAKQNQTLASLDNNIKCGNSIVDSKEVAGELAFDWEKEFPEVFEQGGFDVIIGNPPYGATIDASQKEYISTNYSTTEGNFDTYKIFFELGFEILKNDGYLGYITPNTYFDLKRSGTKLRKYLFSNTLLKIVELYNVFPNVIVEPVISIYQKRPYNKNAELEVILIPRNTELTSSFIIDGVSYLKKQEDLRKNEDYTFNYKINDDATVIIDIKKHSKPLKEFCCVFNGAKPYEVGKGIPKQTKEMMRGKVYNGYEKIDDTWVPYMRGKCIGRFTNRWDGEFIKYGENLAAPRSSDVFFREKIFVRQTADEIVATLDDNNVGNNTLHVVFPKDNVNISNLYVLGLLNSVLMTWIYQREHPLEVNKPMAEVKKVFLEDLPLIIGNNDEVARVEQLTSELLDKCQHLYDQKQIFLEYILKAYDPKKLSDKLYKFETLSFNEFIAEMRIQKVKLHESQKMELLPLYEKTKKELRDWYMQICKLMRDLDETVFKIYRIPNNIANIICHK